MSNAIVLPMCALAVVDARPQAVLHDVRAMFTMSSMLCGLAPSLTMLIFFRVLQGSGGRRARPSEQGILADTFPPQKRGMAMAIYGMADSGARDLGRRSAAGSPTITVALDFFHQRAGGDLSRCA